jgi:hypothetical protein
VPYGAVPPETFNHVSRMYDVYRHTVDAPHD